MAEEPLSGLWLRVHTAAAQVVPVKAAEVKPLVCAFGSLFCILAAYFCLLPLREDAGISLGTSTLPALFASSLVITVLVAPVVSAFLARHQPQHRGRALRQLYSTLAAVLLVFYMLYSISAVHTQHHTQASSSAGRHVQQMDPNQQLQQEPPQQQFQQQQYTQQLEQHKWQQQSAEDHATATPSPEGIAVRRLLQTVGSTDASLPQQTATQQPTSHFGKAGDSLLTHQHNTPSTQQPAQQFDSRAGDSLLTQRQRWLRASFYGFINVMNLVSISAMWARCAETFAPEAAARLFGLISAGATLGQLAGSVAAMAISRHASSSSSTSSGPTSTLMLLGALLMAAAGQLAVLVRAPAGTATAAATAKIPPALQEVGTPHSSPRSRRSTGAGSILMQEGASRHQDQRQPPLRRGAGLFEGFRLVKDSPYLLLVCGYMLMTYVVGSLMYFERALVVARQVKGASGRTAFFATLNTYSAAIIVTLQLFATGSLLRTLGVPWALGLGPAICMGGLALIAARPLPSSVAGVEIVRKVFGYAINRPAREVLFTVLSREEKIKAKVVIDTVVQRMGDTLAAAAFAVLDVRLSLGPNGVAAAGCLMCMVWLAVALRLGRQHASRVAPQPNHKF